MMFQKKDQHSLLDFTNVFCNLKVQLIDIRHKNISRIEGSRTRKKVWFH